MAGSGKIRVYKPLSNIQKVYGFSEDNSSGFLALDTNSKLFGWGYNQTGLLGIGDKLDIFLAEEVKTNIRQVWTTGNTQASDSSVNFSLDNSNILYYTGDNTQGQAGNGIVSTSSWTQITQEPFDGSYKLVLELMVLVIM